MLSQQILNRIEVGLCVIGADKRIVLTNREAERLFSLEDARLRVRANRLVFSDENQTRLFEEFIDKATCAVATEKQPETQPNDTSLFITLKSEFSRCLLELSSMSGCKSNERIVEYYLLKITDTDKKMYPSATKLTEIFSLTKAETAVCQQLVEGHDSARIAKERGVGLETIKTQVRSIYRKIGVTRRSELVLKIICSSACVLN